MISNYCERICGNGRIDYGEACDDSGFADDDGCDSSCQLEEGFLCWPFGETPPMGYVAVHTNADMTYQCGTDPNNDSSSTT